VNGAGGVGGGGGVVSGGGGGGAGGGGGGGGNGSGAGGSGTLDPDASTDVEGDDDYDVETKKAMRAERNRQSAAASRERKKHHIRELERRVSVLSAENAQLQVEQLKAIRARISTHRALAEENDKLKRNVRWGLTASAGVARLRSCRPADGAVFVCCMCRAWW